MSDLADLAPIIIPYSILAFNVIGIFGNSNILIATYRLKHLRSKHGCLLCLLSFYHTVCLLFELVNVAYALRGGIIYRNTCFQFMALYLVFSCLQSTMFLVISLDLLLTVVTPIRHMITPIFRYLCIVSVPAVAYAALIISLAMYYMLVVDRGVNPVIILCNPPLSMHPVVTNFWSRFNGYCNLASLAFYAAIYAIVYVRDQRAKTTQFQAAKKVSDERKVMRSLTWLIVCFVFTWCFCMFTVDIAQLLGLNDDWRRLLQSYAVLFALLAYSMNYYVYFIRSKPYRRAFVEQLNFILPKKLSIADSDRVQVAMHLYLLWWKDLRYHRSHKTQTVVQFVLPIFMSILATAALFRMGNYDMVHKKASMVSYEKDFDWADTSIPWKIAVFVNSTPTLPAPEFQALKEFFGQACNQSCTVYDKARWNNTYLLKPTTKGLLVIDEWNVKKPSLKYRIVDLTWSLNRNLAPLWGIYSQDQSMVDGRNLAGDIYAPLLQKMLEGHFYSEVKPGKDNPFRSSVLHRAMPLLNHSTVRAHLILTNLATFVCILSIWQMAHQLDGERQHGARLLLRNHNILRLQYFGWYFVNYSIKMLLCQLLFWTAPIIITKNAFDALITVPGLIVYSCVLSSFALLSATVFRTKWAARIGSSLVLFCLHLGQLHMGDSSASLKHSILRSFLFPSALYYYMRAAATRIMTGGFITASMMTSVHSLPFLLISAVSMFLLAIYIDTVYPGLGENGEDFIFLFRISYWMPHSAPAVCEDESLMKETMLTEEIINKKEQQSNNVSKPSAKETLVELKGVSYSENDQYVVSRASIKAGAGEVVVLYGPRGGGGSTILKLIAGHLTPEFGEILRGASKTQSVKTTSNPDPVIGYSGGHFVIPHLTVIEQLRWLVQLRGGKKDDLFAMMEELQLLPFMDTVVTELNTCQHQLLSLISCFVGGCEIVLLDEPTGHCPPGLRNIMHGFIMRRKVGRTIILSTYDPQDAEMVGDQIVFLVEGHVSASGTIGAVRGRYAKCNNLVVWPAKEFDTDREQRIETLINEFIPSKKAVKFERMPNMSIRFFIPTLATIPLAKIISDIERNRDHLGVKYCEVVRQNLQEAYYSCCRACDKASGKLTDIVALVAPLQAKYNGERKPSCWPELSAVWLQRRALLRRRYIHIAASFILPAIGLSLLGLSLLHYRLTADSIQINRKVLEDGLVPRGQLVSNFESSKVELNGMTYTHQDKPEVFSSSPWMYDEPTYICGLVQEKKKNLTLYHLYSHRLVRFGDLIVNNMLTNFLLGKEDAVKMSLESLDSAGWSTKLIKELSKLQNERSSILGSVKARHLSSILINGWPTLLAIGGGLTVLLSHSTLFVGYVVQQKCIRMHYLLGARPLFYWLAILFFDVVQFIIVLGLFSPLIYFLLMDNLFALCLCLLSCLLAFVCSLPSVYAMSFHCGHPVASFFLCLIEFGTIALLPAVFPFLSLQFGDRLNWWSSFSVVLSMFCPSLAAALTSTIGANLLIIAELPLKKVIVVVLPMLIAPLVQLLAWVILFICNSDVCLRKFALWKFKLEKSCLRPQDMVMADRDEVSILSLASDASIPSVTATSGSTSEAQTTTTTGTTLASSGRATGGADQYVELEERIRAVSMIQAAEAEHKNERTMMVDLWAHRDEVGVAEPVIEFKAIPLAHYKELNHFVDLCTYEAQAMNLFGELPEVRSKLLDFAASQSFPGEGTVTIKQKPAGVFSKVSYVPQDERLNKMMTPRETLEMAAILKHYVKKHDIVKQVLEATDLTKQADTPIELLCISDRRMVALAVAVIDRPTALLLDEMDMYISPKRMKMVWAIACLLREKCQVPVVFSTPRVCESESASSHTVMLFKGAVSMAETTLDIKKRFTCLATLTVTLKLQHMNKEMTSNVIINQLDCQMHPHPHPQKIAFLISIPDGKYVETLSKVRSLMATIGIADYIFATPDLDIIYSANFTSYIERP